MDAKGNVPGCFIGLSTIFYFFTRRLERERRNKKSIQVYTENKERSGEMEQATEKKGLGTLEGVFTPTILTILGVVMYLRLGWVVGNVGLIETIIIILLAHSITICTALSMASMVSNIEIGAGGAYAIISRPWDLKSAEPSGFRCTFPRHFPSRFTSLVLSNYGRVIFLLTPAF